MKKLMTICIAVLSIFFVSLWGGYGFAQDLPVVKGNKIVASINGEPITLDTFNQELASIKGTKSPGEAVDKKAELELLKRLINARLIIQEARNIGLDKLPEVKMMVDSFAKEALRAELAARITKDVKVDENAVERIYKESTREWKVSALRCENEQDAKSLEAELQGGRNFEEVAKKFIEEKKATRGEDGVYLKVKDLDPQFRRVLSNMAIGSTSPILHTNSGYVIVRFEGSRNIENPEEKEKVRQEILTEGKLEAIKAYDAALKKKYVKVYPEVLKSIDYESKSPSFEALLKDTRVVAGVKGEKPVTVGELTEELKRQFFHGTDSPSERKKLNARKDQVLEAIVHRRVFRKEALRLGLDKTESYRNKVKEHENGLLFGTFINKVIIQEVKLKEEELKAYYIDHIKEFTTPEMMRIQSLVFGKRADAEGAIEKLKEGAEFQWLADHLEGQTDKNANDVLSFEGRLLTTDDFPEGVRKAIAGARPGDLRLYASPEGHFYALVIQDVVPSKPQPYEESRQGIATKLFDEKVGKALEEYAEKLRSLSEVKVYLKG